MAHPALAATEHRPWPLEPRPWALAMQWHDLLFAHWPVAPSALVPLLPASLELDLWDGRAWVGVVPFRMSGVRARFLPPFPGAAAFPELNLRTYVRSRDGARRAGVWFWSLDAASALAVRAARWTFGLPYFDAAMECGHDGDDVVYRSERTHRDAPAAAFAGRYAPIGPVFHAERGSLEEFLTERYCLYAMRGGHLLRGEIHHAPWPLQRADAEIATSTVAAAAGIRLPDETPHLLFARRLDVVAWRPVTA